MNKRDEGIKEVFDRLERETNTAAYQQEIMLKVLDSIDCFIIPKKDQDHIQKTFKTHLDMIIPNEHRHPNFKSFQEQYGIIPKSDKNDAHLIKSRMLQGIYRNQKSETTYCNHVSEDDNLTNFMQNKRLKEDVDKELLAIKGRDRLTDETRLYTNLLSSQPMAFNIFLPLKWDINVGNSVFKDLFPQLHIKKLVDIKMEYVPCDENGKESRITRDRSCFDVYVEYENDNGELGGIGIEVKYTEPFSQSNYWIDEAMTSTDEKQRKKKRYTDAIQEYSELFSEEHEEQYLRPTYNQLFRNQLIVEEVKKHTAIKNCILVVAHSEEDKNCTDRVEEFQKLIKIKGSCVRVSINQIIRSAIENSADFPEIKELYEKIYDRYCNYDLVNKFFEE